MKIDFEKASFKDFKNIEGLDPYGWAKLWGEYVTDQARIDSSIIGRKM